MRWLARAMPAKVIVTASAAASLNPLRRVLSELPADLDAAVLVVQHPAAPSGTLFARMLRAVTPLEVVSVDGRESIRAGAVGYVLKQVGNEELLRAIAAAARGEALIDPSTTARLLSRVRDDERKSDEDAFRELSEREMDVLVELAQGKKNAEIGQALNLSEKTVRNYVSSILEKLHLDNRIELATYAVKHRISDRYDRK